MKSLQSAEPSSIQGNDSFPSLPPTPPLCFLLPLPPSSFLFPLPFLTSARKPCGQTLTRTVRRCASRPPGWPCCSLQTWRTSREGGREEGRDERKEGRKEERSSVDGVNERGRQADDREKKKRGKLRDGRREGMEEGGREGV